MIQRRYLLIVVQCQGIAQAILLRELLRSLRIVHAIDAKNHKIRIWEVPVPYAGAYDVQFDDVKYAWGADMSTDLVQRLNVDTSEWSSYLLPLSINTRHVDVEKSSDPNVPSSMWTEGQQNGKIVHIEPLTP